MKVLDYVDLGKAFEKLKKDLIEIDQEAKKSKSDYKYPYAYGRLTACVQSHICMNTDTSFTELGELLREQKESVNDIPKELFSKPGIEPPIADIL